MKLQQIRYLREIVDHDMVLSAAAATLNTSQSGLSRHIKALEAELGSPLLVRRGKRILRLTASGEAVLEVGRRMLLDAERIQRVTDDRLRETEGDFVVATTHLHARYALPETVRTFITRYPKVRLSLLQGTPVQIAEWVAAGRVDLSICAAPPVPMPGVLLLPYYELQRVVLARPGHPILKAGKLTLGTIARYPMITYDASFPGRATINTAFERAGLQPRIVLSATDADLMKAYVKLGFGIAVVGAIAFDARQDRDLRALDARHLFPPNQIHVGLNRSRSLRGYMFEFISLFAPHLTRKVVEKALAAPEQKKAPPPRPWRRTADQGKRQ
ncbi:MAG TPA: LysR substrate-binding domain-containing protein [Pseudolabrys sp.]|jgi:LysR family cys regulon transcriptional activator|nr:LysR substrate-binding domain-containing protein [Pseudolabrys sp.]